MFHTSKYSKTGEVFAEYFKRKIYLAEEALK